MPKADKHSTICRLWEMLNMIPNRAPGILVRTLVEQLEEKEYAVTVRTVERDLNAMSHFPWPAAMAGFKYAQ